MFAGGFKRMIKAVLAENSIENNEDVFISLNSYN